jgi:hypothetical protein
MAEAQLDSASVTCALIALALVYKTKQMPVTHAITVPVGPGSSSTNSRRRAARVHLPLSKTEAAQAMDATTEVINATTYACTAFAS